MTATEYWVGAACLVTTLGGTGAAAAVLVRAWCVGLAGAIRVLAWALLTLAALLVTHLGPGALGLLTRWTAAGTAVALLVGARFVPRRAAGPAIPAPDPTHPDSAVERAVARVAGAAGAVWLAIAFADQRATPPEGFDALSAYLPTAARWVQDGSIWGLADWLPGFFFGASPGNGSTVVAAVMLPWRNEFAAQLAIFPFLPLLVLAVRCLAREVGAPGSTATLLGLAAGAVPVVVEPGVVSGLPDPILYASFAAGLAFLARHHRTGDAADLGLAGVGLGIAFGTKLYGMTAVPVVWAVWVAARLLARHRPALVARQAAAVVGLVAAFGGLWVLRTTVATGNPVFPVSVPALGLDAPADPYRERIGFTLASYLDDPEVLAGELRHQFRIAVGLPLVVLAAALLAAVAVAVARRRAGRGAGVAITGVAVTAVLAASYALTPHSAVGLPGLPYAAAANVRYGIPALIAATGVAGWLAGRLAPWPRRVLAALVLVAAVDALRIGTTLPASRILVAAGVAATLAVGARPVVAWSRRPLGEEGRRFAGAVLGHALIVLVLGLGALGRITADDYLDARYLGHDPALDWVATHTADGAQVGVTGSWSDRGLAPTYPLFGERLQNEVTFVGPTDDGLLGTYDDAASFVEAVEADEIDVLVVGRTEPYLDAPPVEEVLPEGQDLDREVLTELLSEPPAPVVADEQRWAEEEGFTVVASSDRFVVLTRP